MNVANEIVYLFELDSIRNSKEEIINGQKKLFTELMKGNIVALSYNQVCSDIFVELLENTKSRKYIFSLFKNRRICILEYDSDNLLDYMIKALQNDKFIFSNMFLVNESYTEYLYELKVYIYNFIKNKRNKKIVNDFKRKFINNNHSKNFSLKRLNNYLLNLKFISENAYYINQTTIHNLKKDTLSHYILLLIKTFENASNKTKKHSKKISKETFQNAKNFLVHNITYSGITRSTLLTASSTIRDEKVKHLVQTIVSMAYNFEIENSNSNITPKHDINDEKEVSDLIYLYYYKHRFENNVEDTTETYSNVKIFSKNLDWESVTLFCDKISQDNITSERLNFLAKENKFCWKKHKKMIILKQIVITILWVSLIFAIELFLIYSNIKAYTNIIKYITTNLIIFLLNVILYIFPLDKIDGVLSIIKCYRIIDTYKKSKKNQVRYKLAISFVLWLKSKYLNIKKLFFNKY